MRFHEIVFCKNFAVNLMLFCQLHKLSYWWNNRSEFNHIHKTNQNYITVIILMKLHEQNVLEHIFVNYNYIKTIFFNWWNYFNSWTEWKSVTVDVWTWQWMFYLNLIIKFDYWKCFWIWLHVWFLSHVMYKNWSHFFNKFSFFYNVLYFMKTS